MGFIKTQIRESELGGLTDILEANGWEYVTSFFRVVYGNDEIREPKELQELDSVVVTFGLHAYYSSPSYYTRKITWSAGAAEDTTDVKNMVFPLTGSTGTASYRINDTSSVSATYAVTDSSAQCHVLVQDQKQLLGLTVISLVVTTKLGETFSFGSAEVPLSVNPVPAGT